MVYLKRWNWLWLLPCALFWLMPNAAAAQSAQMTQPEGQCVVSTTKDALRNDPRMQQQIDQTLSQVRAQSCQSGEQAAQQQFIMMMYPVLAGMTQHQVLMKCFPTLLQQKQDAQTHEKLNMIIQAIQQIIVQTLMQTVPRPLCP